MSASGLVEREAGDVRVQVPRVLDPALAVGHGRGVQAPQPGPEVVVPVADRVVLEQQGLDARVLARLGPLGVAREVARTTLDVGPEHDRLRRARGRDAAHATLGRGEQARLATIGREGPQRVDLLLRVRLGVRVGSHRLEQERAVGQERDPGALALDGAGERRAGAVSVGSTCHSEVAIFLPSGATAPTATTRRVPSGLSLSAERRGRRSMVSIVKDSVMPASSHRPATPAERRSRAFEHLYQSGFQPAIFRAMTDDPMSLLAAGANDVGELAVEGSLRPRTLDEYIGQREVKANLDVLLRRRRAGERRPTTSCSTARPASARRRSRRSSPASSASTSATRAGRRSSARATSPRSSPRSTSATSCSSTRSTASTARSRRSSTRRWRTSRST